jgi:group I intron endonuclease
MQIIYIILLFFYFKTNIQFVNLISIVPVVSYSNADTQRLEILKENNKKSGIYRWTHIKTGKSYIGSALNITKRLIEYYSISLLERTISKGNSKICRALLKYGYSQFNLDILEYCDSIQLIKREQYYIYKIKPELNILTIAGSSLGFKHSEVTKELLRKINLGRIVSSYTRSKNSLNNFKSVTITVFNTITKETLEFSTISRACSYMGIFPTHFKYYLNRQPIKGNFNIIKIGNIEHTILNTIDKEYINIKAQPVCIINEDTLISTQFLSIEAAEHLGVTKSYLSRCIKLNKSCRGHSIKKIINKLVYIKKY